MKVTIEPETDDERTKAKPRTYTGLNNLALVALTYENDVLRKPTYHTHGDLIDLMREMGPLYYLMLRRQLAIDTTDAGS